MLRQKPLQQPSHTKRELLISYFTSFNTFNN
jgi:hypothetical protein